jgi:hypothetical protein
VLIECWPLFWVLEGEGSEQTRLPVIRLGLGDLPVLSRYYTRPGQLLMDWVEARIAPVYSNRFVLVTQYARYLLPPATRREDMWPHIHPSGWLYRPWEPTQEQCQKYVESIRCAQEVRLHKLDTPAYADRALHELLDLCKREGIRAGLLYMPEAARFREAYPPEVRARLNAYLTRLAKEYEIPFIDTRDWMEDEHFTDAFHLRNGGAEEFSRRFGETVLPDFLHSAKTNAE